MFDNEPKWGPIGKEIYERTYSRSMPDGKKETWRDTVKRFVDGNLALVPHDYIEKGEKELLYEMCYNFKVLPAGRHIWVSGIPGRQFVLNCHNASWSDKFSDHFAFMFDELMKGGGVGSSYSNDLLSRYTDIFHDKRQATVHIVCDKQHPDYSKMLGMGLLSSKYASTWRGAYRIEDSRKGWVDALSSIINYVMKEEDIHEQIRDLIQDDIILDVGLVRCEGSLIRGFGGTASGPWALARCLIDFADTLNKAEEISSLTMMKLDHVIASCVIAGNVRRSARMSMKHWQDQDIREFINCKVGNNSHWTTNISVIIDDKFLKEMKRKNTRARRLLEECVTAMILRGEPGFWNVTLSNYGEPRPVESTNPCGEISLMPWEACNLGHVNLGLFDSDDEARKAFRLMTRFLIRATFGDICDPKQKKIMDENRRIGVGFFGFHDWLIKQGIKFSECHAEHFGIGKRLRSFYQEISSAAREYAFQLRIPEPVKKTTIAPTGTIAEMCGGAKGCCPIYAPYFLKRVRIASNSNLLKEFSSRAVSIEDDITSKSTKVVAFACKDILCEKVPEDIDEEGIVEGATDIHIEDHLAVQAMIQREYADNSISYTANVAMPSFIRTERNIGGVYCNIIVEGKEEEFSNYVHGMVGVLIRKLPQLKGTTVLFEGSYEQAPYEKISKEQYEELSNGANNVSQPLIDCKGGSCPIK